jgi:hypothetical protein
MYGRLRRITFVELERLQSNPESVEEFVSGKALANAGAAEDALARVQKLVTEFQMSAKASDPAEQEKIRASILKDLEASGVRIPGESTEEGLSLEKSWHVIHYLLTGKIDEAPPPLGNAVLGGEEIGEERDYGPVRFLTPQEVREVAEALASISKDDLLRRFDIESMRSAQVIYPIRSTSEGELAQHYFERMSHYYADAAASGDAMLLWIE